MYLVHVGKSHDEPAPNHHLRGPAAPIFWHFSQTVSSFLDVFQAMLAQDRAMIEQLQRKPPRDSAVRKKPPTPPKVSQRGERFLGRHRLNMWMTC